MWRMILLAGASVAALASTAAEAASFNYTGSVQTYTVTQTGIYTLRAAGAQGGNMAGLGALVSGKLSLNSGTVLNILVGGQGGNGSPTDGGGGGGGGTFIYRDLATLLAVAGGGGGGSYGLGGFGGTTGAGGTGFGGTGGGYVGGGGGGGWNGAGSSGTICGGAGGLFTSISSGACGGGSGGFGGGGGGGGYSGGGGGGFSGGGGGAYAGGGGGGSFLAASATDAVLTAGANTGDGSASIDLFSVTGGVPEPSSWAMLITGFGGIGAMLRRRRLRTA